MLKIRVSPSSQPLCHTGEDQNDFLWIPQSFEHILPGPDVLSYPHGALEYSQFGFSQEQRDKI